MLSGTKGKNVLAFSEILQSRGKETRALWPGSHGDLGRLSKRQHRLKLLWNRTENSTAQTLLIEDMAGIAFSLQRARHSERD